MAPVQTEGLIVCNKRIKTVYYLLEISCPPIAERVKPGQFVMLQVSEDRSPLLRRPFSIYKTYANNHPEKKKRGLLFILYKEIGRGSRRMTFLKKGDKVDLIGPLGNGFVMPPLPSSGNRILIGGGIGIVSLYPLVEAFGEKGCLVFIGGRTEYDILCAEDFKKFHSRIFIATEDGSFGYRGTVVDLFLSQRKCFKRNETYYLYACGPVAMLKSLAGAEKPENIICYASLEARMACGFGACLGCVIKTKQRKTSYQRVCEEGPVFRLDEIVWG